MLTRVSGSSTLSNTLSGAPPPPTQPEAGSGANCSLLLSGKASCGRKRCPAGGCFVPQVEEVGVEGVRGQRAKGEPKSLVFSLIFY